MKWLLRLWVIHPKLVVASTAAGRGPCFACPVEGHERLVIDTPPPLRDRLSQRVQLTVRRLRMFLARVRWQGPAERPRSVAMRCLVERRAHRTGQLPPARRPVLRLSWSPLGSRGPCRRSDTTARGESVQPADDAPRLVLSQSGPPGWWRRYDPPCSRRRGPGWRLRRRGNAGVDRRRPRRDRRGRRAARSSAGAA